MVEPDPYMIRVKASSFEILKNTNQPSEEAKQQLSGYIGIDDYATLEALKELCAQKNIDKVIVVYHDYAFSLLGVSFSDNKESDSIKLDASNTYKFQANDVHLEALAS